MSSSTILIVHGETPVREAARVALERAGHKVLEADRLKLADIGQPDLLLISWKDLGPLAGGLAALRESQGNDGLKVVALAPRKHMASAIRLLEYGADDCVPVPFDVNELIARINACLRRPPATTRPERLSAGPILLDKAVHQVVVQDKVVDLAPTEFRLMCFFLENPDRVFSRGELLRRAWTKNVKAGQRTVDVHVRRLRQQLEPFGCEGAIQTVRGFGYRFSADALKAERASMSRLAIRVGRP